VSTARIRHFHAKNCAQAVPAGGGEADSARPSLMHEPAAFKTAAAYLGADMAGDVIAPLAPVQAGSAKDAAAAGRRHKRAAEAGEEAFTGHRQLTAFVTQYDVFLSHQRVGDGYTQPTGEMVITSAGETQRIVLRRTRLIARRRLQRGYGLDAFQHFRHQRRSDPVITVAPLLGDGEQPRLRELAQMLAGGRSRYPRELGQLAAG